MAMDSKDRMKLILAIVGIVAAGGLLAWTFGLFEGNPKTQSEKTLEGVQKDAAGMPKGGGARTPPGAPTPK